MEHDSTGALQDSPTEMDESSRLKELQADVRNQDDLVRDITRRADQVLVEQADERDNKRLEKARSKKEKVDAQIFKLLQRLSQPIGTSARVRLQSEVGTLESRSISLSQELKEIRQRIDDRHRKQEDDLAIWPERMPNEPRRDFLIRTGKITPFSSMGTDLGEIHTSSLHDALIDAEDERDEKEALDQGKEESAISHRNLVRPSFEFDESESTSVGKVTARPVKRRKIGQSGASRQPTNLRSDAAVLEDVTSDELDDSKSYVASEEPQSMSEYEDSFDSEEEPVRKVARHKAARTESIMEDFTKLDDGNENFYQFRLKKWASGRAAARKHAIDARRAVTEGNEALGPNNSEANNCEESFMPHPTTPDLPYSNGFSIPGDIHPYLFDYQKTGVQWLWELHQQQVGGIIGDEMGLGKTIQIIAFLAGLHYNRRLTKPAIIICPATVMKQWVNEFHRWWPPFRVSILHSSGSGMVNIKRESSKEDSLLSKTWSPEDSYSAPTGNKVTKEIVQRLLREGHILVTTYSGLQRYSSMLIKTEWGCAVLDEGHKIRNPHTSITIHCKELRTPHRLILSGTPMQNNLTELWSLFDFVFPMRLGTLVNFRNQFEFPIRQGGYANASNLQIQTAAKCAETLKDAISPYLLQRFKIDVAADLPKKSEQVLFCKLTKPQRTAYRAFLDSGEMGSILKGRRQVLYGVDILRKICNHPDLQKHKSLSGTSDYGNAARSGKMQVVKALLGLWKETGHKTLLFTQHRIMLDILEKFVKSLNQFTYRRMDGTTPIRHRQPMVDEFNMDKKIDVFLLTTKVGGLGVNLTGADRVIIYDPDWNPSTDIQARERAWRLGQKRDVIVYRLMTAGTIEEKIYHRQIFKQFLTNKILKDPKQRQTFQFGELHDLFSLNDEQEGPTETSKLFKGTEVTYEEKHEGDPQTSAGYQAEALYGKWDEGKDIGKAACVTSAERFQGEPKDESGLATGEYNSGDRIMESLFAKSGVHSALEHDNIVNGKRVVRADPKIIAAEARRVAGEAAEELRKAEMTARQVPIGVPTWTGQAGVAGRPGGAPRYGSSSRAARGAAAGPSSASILAHLSNYSAPTESARVACEPSGGDFMVMIRDFITSHGGAVHTKMLIDQFNRYCTTPQRSAEFKEMLKTIAELERGGRGGRGRWTLRPEFARK